MVLTLFLAVTALSAAPTGKRRTRKKVGKLSPELMKLKELQMKLKLENSIAAERLKKVLSELRFQQMKLALENKLLMAKGRKRMLMLQEKTAKTKRELMRLKMEMTRLSLQRARESYKLAQLRTKMAIRKNRDKAHRQVGGERFYTRYPYKKGILTISDRRIQLNGAIIRGVADYVTKRIHYFNNKSTRYPIFIVIDTCPGGSVMEGYRILKAMRASKAPVYVVVKSFAASMAAVITTLAEKSFAYPNAVILHHQMSTITWGNMTVLKEQLRLAREWERRLHAPVAKKMGIGTKQFVKLMYKHNSRGDWEEFADKARKLKWVDHVVKGIQETAFRDKPTDKKPKLRFFWFGGVKRDTAGRRYVELPRLVPFDFYFIYNPDRFYR